jgi:hypothetical protein
LACTGLTAAQRSTTTTPLSFITFWAASL